MKQKRILTFLLCLSLLTGLCSGTALAAPTWPADVVITAEGGIVMDADTGAVLYGKNIHLPYYPASITKILTALIVLENCDMEETVTYSHNAVYNVEAGSSSAGIDEGDQLSVRDSLYAMLLKSANEAANGLAEHVSGSVEAFAELMNDKARSLGCRDSHFSNPSGLNDPEHYTSAYDMALIAQAAFRNEAFVEIDSTLYYDIPQTKKNPDGIRVYPGHKMMKKNTAQYYPGIIGGKTGYTSLAGNTLVTCARRDGMTLITVILNGQQTHYADTKTLLDFGFSNFKTVPVTDSVYTSVENDMTIAGLPAAQLSVLRMQDNCLVTLPNNAEVSDTTSSITYDLTASAPQQAVAQISYQYDERQVGVTYLMKNDTAAAAAPLAEVPEARALNGAPDSELPPADVSETDEPAPESARSPASDTGFHLHIPKAFWIVSGILAAAAAVLGVLLVVKARIEKKEEEERLARYQRRQERLQDIGMSSAEFDMMMHEKRANSALKTAEKKKRRPGKHKSFLDDKKF